MIDFKRRMGGNLPERRTNPKEIYEALDRKSEVGPLRPSQEFVLAEWFENRRDKKNNIIKLHTGEGKTLIGLLILNSKINLKSGPCVYVCPNKFLFQQTCAEAERFGVPFCTFTESEIPNEFLNGEKMLITYVQKIFHGLTRFGIDSRSTEVGTIVLDDSHACIESIRDSFTIKVKHGHQLYNDVLTTFGDDLRNQGEGTYIDIFNKDYDSLLPVPYWSWFEKSHDFIELIAKQKNTDEVKYGWPLLKDSIDKCQVFISGNSVEIVPYYTPIHKYAFFHDAKCRVLMSATTQDDSFLIRGLDFDISTVQNPIVFPELKWSGEKMVIIPSLINEDLDRDLVITNLVTKNDRRQYGIVALVPDFKKANQYEAIGARVAKTESINDIVAQLRAKRFAETIVIANRYDGIDLPDESCRVLVIDSKPYFISLSEKYEESVRSTSDVTNVRIAQKIEQGLGRSVRGEKDYSVIILIGPDLVQIVKSAKTAKYFSSQTRKQIEIGMNVMEFAKEDYVDDGTSIFKIVQQLIAQVLKRDEGWKDYYKEEMDRIEPEASSTSLLTVLHAERQAESEFYFGRYQSAAEKFQVIADLFSGTPEEKGWYTQALARVTYFLSKTDSNTVQTSAFNQNRYLLKPRDGVNYEKIIIVEDQRIQKIRQWIASHSDFMDLYMNVNRILDDFAFGVEADKFEEALKKVGEMLGFESQRPDKEYKKGPDNLWCGAKNNYIFFECKSEVDVERDEINKTEAGQMNSHCGWFENEYGTSVSVKRVWIHPTKKLSYYCDLTHEVVVMRRAKLKELRGNILSFFKEFAKNRIGDVSDATITSHIVTHKLDLDSLNSHYFELVVQPRKV